MAQISLPLVTGAGDQVQQILGVNQDLDSSCPSPMLIEELRGEIQEKSLTISGSFAGNCASMNVFLYFLVQVEWFR